MKTRCKVLTSMMALGSSVCGIALYLGLMATVAITPGCSGSGSNGDKCTLEIADATLDDQTICASTAFTGTTEIFTNPFFPYSTPGAVYVLSGTEDGESIEVVITVGGTDTTTVPGITLRVVNETESVDGVLVEDTDDYYAQADDGTVCYFGESVTNILEDGSTNADGSWVVDFVTNFPGIIIPKVADIAVGAIYLQERAPGIAEDMSEVIAVGESITVPQGTHTDTFSGNDCNPLDREAEDLKVYARGVGIVFDNGIELQSIN